LTFCLEKFKWIESTYKCATTLTLRAERDGVIERASLEPFAQSAELVQSLKLLVFSSASGFFAPITLDLEQDIGGDSVTHVGSSNPI